ncbi:MAG: DUF2344 domain-containing protein, partial [Agathobacter sp.]
ASPLSYEEWNGKVTELFVEADAFTIVKKTKKSEREVDLKPLVYDFKVREQDGKPAFYIHVSTGSVDNIKPELLLASMYEKLGLEYREEAIAIHRIDVYATDEKTGKFISLLEMGTTIE